MNRTSHNAMAVHMASCDPAQGRQAIMPAPGAISDRQAYGSALRSFTAPNLPPVGWIDTSIDEREMNLAKPLWGGDFIEALDPEVMASMREDFTASARYRFEREMICTPVYDDGDARRAACKVRAREHLGLDGARLYISFNEFPNEAYDWDAKPPLEHLEAMQWEPVLPGQQWVGGDVEFMGEQVSRDEARRRGWLD